MRQVPVNSQLAIKLCLVAKDQNHRVPAATEVFSARTLTRYSEQDVPEEHFADESILVYWLFVLAFWDFSPHLKEM